MKTQLVRHWGLRRDVATGGPGGMAHDCNFRTKQGPQISVSNIRDIAFLEIIRFLFVDHPKEDHNEREFKS